MLASLITLAVIVGKIGMSTLTGKPGGNFISIKSRSFPICFTGATTSKTSNNIHLDSGKSWHCKLQILA